MQQIDPTIALLVTGFLVLASVLASRASDRIGVPAVLIFLGVGMLAGSDGIGRIPFDNAEIANLVGTVALAFILFSGGLDTNWRYIRPVLVRGTLLSTGGVVMTAGLVGLFVWLVLGLPLLTSLLIGAIISSTDAAAVFSVLRGRGVALKGKLKPLLELESGSNDPLAIFLTLGLTQLLVVPDFNGWILVPALFVNMGAGVAVGFLIGKAAGYLFNRIRLDYEGLYPVLSLSLVLLTFGATELVMGNGFLAVYVCGIMLNGTNFTHKRFVLKFHDGLAWLMQILMFLVLGMLVFPSQLPAIAPKALMVAGFLMFVARPVAVYLALWGSDFTKQERTLAAWTGLRGAVPIVLATFPLMAGYTHSDMIFNMVFFTVLTSVLVQGTLLMPVARLLRVDEPLQARPEYSLEIERHGLPQGETREVEILPDMDAVGKTIADLEIPPDVLVLLIGRGENFVVPRGQTHIEAYDTLLMLGDQKALQTAHDVIVTPPTASRRKIEAKLDPLSVLPMTTDQRFLSKQVVIIGYGRVGRRIAGYLSKSGVPYVVVDENRSLVEDLRRKEIPAVLGDATRDIILAQAHVAKAHMLIIATPDTLKVREIVDVARALNPRIHVVIRSHSEMEAHLLEQEKAGRVFLGEHELAANIYEYVIEYLGRK